MYCFILLHGKLQLAASNNTSFRPQFCGSEVWHSGNGFSAEAEITHLHFYPHARCADCSSVSCQVLMWSSRSSFKLIPVFGLIQFLVAVGLKSPFLACCQLGSFSAFQYFRRIIQDASGNAHHAYKCLMFFFFFISFQASNSMTHLLHASNLFDVPFC